MRVDEVHSTWVEVSVVSAGVSIVEGLESGNEKSFWESAAPVVGS